MSDWPFGISTGCFYRRSIFDCLEEIRRAGFLIIEVCSSPGHLDYHNTEDVRRAAARIQELGLEVYSFHAPFSENIDISALEESIRRQAYSEIIQAAEAAAILNARYFVIHPGPENSFTPPSSEKMRRMELGAQILDQVAYRCRELGVGFVLENMLPHLLLGNIRDMLWMLGSMSSIDVGICLDTGHAALSGSLDRSMYKLSGHLQLIHAHDNRGQNDDHLPPGRGTIDWHRLLSSLDDIDFHGGFILELSGEDDRNAAEILADARSSRSFLRNISRRLALS
jgi:sugar phosphate isomerase/epimerase